MPDVKEMFPRLMKPQRVRRGTKAEFGWIKNTLTITYDTLAAKLAHHVIDSSVKREASVRRGEGNLFEVRRYVLKSNRKFGYLCFKTIDHPLECNNYATLQVIFNKLSERIKWFNSLEELVTKCSLKCSSKEYVIHLNQIMTQEGTHEQT